MTRTAPAEDVLSRLERLAGEATPGPWVPGYWSGHCSIKHRHGQADCVYDPVFRSTDNWRQLASPSAKVVDGSGDDGEVSGNYDYDVGGIIHEADARFIAEARNALPPADAGEGLARSGDAAAGLDAAWAWAYGVVGTWPGPHSADELGDLAFALLTDLRAALASDAGAGYLP